MRDFQCDLSQEKNGNEGKNGMQHIRNKRLFSANINHIIKYGMGRS